MVRSEPSIAGGGLGLCHGFVSRNASRRSDWSSARPSMGTMGPLFGAPLAGLGGGGGGARAGVCERMVANDA